jgi:hypothetical protein
MRIKSDRSTTVSFKNITLVYWVLGDASIRLNLTPALIWQEQIIYDDALNC